jgi:hypothetical protein
MHVLHTPTGTWQSSPARTSIQPSSSSSNRSLSPASFSTRHKTKKVSHLLVLLFTLKYISGICSCPTCMFIR